MSHLAFHSPNLFSCVQHRSTSILRACATKPPVLISDVLGTLVRDPFYNGMSSYFGFTSLDQFLAAKTPNLWIDFELGKVNEQQLAENFFRDRPPIDLPHFKQFLKQSYELLPGVADMLTGLQNAGIEVHLCTNYPVWADLIEESLQLTTRFGVKWTFVSGSEGVRKPDKDAYLAAAQKACAHPSRCVFLDDRKENCLGALDAGFLASIHFENANQASKDITQIYLSNDTPLQL